MIKKWLDFIKEDNKVEYSIDYIDIKLNKLKELIDSFSKGHTILYEWKNEDNHEIIINFSYDDISCKYEIDIDNNMIIKVINNKVENIKYNNIEEAMDIIEKEISSILSVS